MFVPTAVALAAAFWTIVLVALAVEKHLFDPALRLWKSLSRFNKCVVAAILFGALAFAGPKPLPGGGDGGGDSTGTNVVEIVEGGASTNLVEDVGSQGEGGAEVKVRGEGEQWNLSTCFADQQKKESNILCSPSPLTFTSTLLSPLTFTSTLPAPLSLGAVGRGEAFDFSAPKGAMVATNWLLHGATSGRIRVSPSDWDFPFGTNVIRNFAAFADGRLEPWPGGDGITLAPMVASLGIVPAANWPLLAPTNRPSLFWWAMRGNALVCTWQNVLLGRETDCPVSFQAELRATGGVTYRYDLGRLASDDPLTNAVVWTEIDSPLTRDLTSLAFRSTEEVACDEFAASFAAAMAGADPFVCPAGSTNTIFEHVFYTGTTNAPFAYPSDTADTAVLVVAVSGVGSGELRIGDTVVPLLARPRPRLLMGANGAPDPTATTLRVPVPKDRTHRLYLRGDSTLSLLLDSDDFAFGALPDLSGRHCRGWINFPYTEASYPCIHSFMAHETDVTLPVGEGADDLACAWNETDDVEVWNRPPRSARIAGRFDPRDERTVTYTLSHPRYLFGETEYEQNVRYCPKPSDDDPTDYLGVGIPFPDECWCCHWQTCDTNCTCGCDTCGRWTDTLTNDCDFARTNYPHMSDVLKIRTPREYSDFIALPVPAGVRNCCPCPEHHTNGVSLVYARRVSVVDSSDSAFRSSDKPVTVRIAATEPSYEPGDGRALFATNGVPMESHDYTCLGVGVSAYGVDLAALNAKNRQFGLPIVVNTNLDGAVLIRLDVNVLLRGGRIRLSVEDATAPLEVWGPGSIRGKWAKFADADTSLDVTMAEWRRMTGHADDDGVPSVNVRLLVPRVGKATIVLHYWNVIDGKFVEDEARQAVTAINPPLLPDYNRDGAINAQDVTNWLGGAAFRYWTNEDAENGDCTDEISGDGANASDLVVNGHLDLVNLFPLALNLKPFVNAWGTAASFELWTRQGNEPMHVCLADIPWNEAGKIQTEEVRTVDDALVATSGLKTVFYDGYTVSNSTVRGFSANSGLLIAEAASPINDSIRLTIRLGEDVVMEHRIPVLIRPVREMYNWINVRHFSDEGESRSTWCGAPSCGSGKSLVFLHGANVSEADAEKWGDTIFKRLWLTGCNVDLYNIDWRSNIGSSANYQQNASNAFEVASRLAPTIAAIPGESTLR